MKVYIKKKSDKKLMENQIHALNNPYSVQRHIQNYKIYTDINSQWGDFHHITQQSICIFRAY